MTRPVLQLHRPWAPDPAAESIQVLAAAHGLSAHRPATVLFRARRPMSAAALLDRHGLGPRPGLTVRLLPAGGTAASVGFWRQVAAFALRTRGRGLFLSRTPRYGIRALRVLPSMPVVAEVHGLDDPMLPELLGGASAAVCNSRGTADGVRRLAPRLPVAVLANAARGPGPEPVGAGEGIGYVGSVRPGKDVELLARLAEHQPVHVVTPDVEAARRVSPRLHVEPALEPALVPARLARFRCVVVPLAPGQFGEVETCPLKLFDALASGRPVVVADAPTLHEGLVPAWVPRYRMGDLADLRRAVDRAVGAAERFRHHRHAVRTWHDRGAELDAFLRTVCP